MEAIATMGSSNQDNYSGLIEIAGWDLKTAGNILIERAIVAARAVLDERGIEWKKPENKGCS